MFYLYLAQGSCMVHGWMVYEYEKEICRFTISTDSSTIKGSSETSKGGRPKQSLLSR
jgi:hypothetical protein